MRTAALRVPVSHVRVRKGAAVDLDVLLDIDGQAFAADRISRRSLRHFLVSPTSRVLVAERDGVVAGYALVLFRPNSLAARLYSIAVAPDRAGSGIGPALLAAAEQAARNRGCTHLRLEVHEQNRRAIELYRKCGYRRFGRLARYYQDDGDAYRFEKALVPHAQSV
jgi:[ribosomal protein S18]-alanine N-acetyltransferase